MTRATRALLLPVLLALAAIAVNGCRPGPERTTPTLTAAEREARILAIADRFAASGDGQAAREALARLNLPDPSWAVLSLAESYIVEGKDRETTTRLVMLASELGPLSRLASDYLGQEKEQVAAQPLPTPTSPPPTATSVPTVPSPTATATQPLPPTATPTATPTSVPYVVVDAQGLNVRSGPGTLYPIIGLMRQGDEADIVARNDEGTWWQVRFDDGSQGWVYAALVTAFGPTEQIALAQHVPPPPPTPTPAPAPTPTPPPKPATPYALTGFRLRSVGEDAQSCSGGDHNIWVTVVDAAGNPLDGVRVREIFTGQVLVTGAQGKGPGRVVFDIFRGGGGVVQIVDESNQPLSPQTPGMSADWPPFDLMLAAGYCNCKPHPNPESCRADLESHSYLFAVGHYVYEVTFQRQ